MKSAARKDAYENTCPVRAAVALYGARQKRFAQKSESAAWKLDLKKKWLRSGKRAAKCILFTAKAASPFVTCSFYFRRFGQLGWALSREGRGRTASSRRLFMKGGRGGVSACRSFRRMQHSVWNKTV